MQKKEISRIFSVEPSCVRRNLCRGGSTPKGIFFKLIDAVRGTLCKNLLPLLSENYDQKMFFLSAGLAETVNPLFQQHAGQRCTSHTLYQDQTAAPWLYVNEVVPALLTNCYRSSRFCMFATGESDAIHLFNISLAGFLNMIGVNQLLALLLPAGLGCSPSWLFIHSQPSCTEKQKKTVVSSFYQCCFCFCFYR